MIVLVASLGFVLGAGNEDKLKGEWRCTSEMVDGKPMNPPYHEQWLFADGGNITINGNRRLKYRNDTTGAPSKLLVHNEANGKQIPIYACLYKFENGKLVVALNAGETPPADFSGSDGISFILTFEK